VSEAFDRGGRSDVLENDILAFREESQLPTLNINGRNLTINDAIKEIPMPFDEMLSPSNCALIDYIATTVTNERSADIRPTGEPIILSNRSSTHSTTPLEANAGAVCPK
jgi:hypothetical protein